MAMEGTGLTSTTAPGKTFDTRKDIADHYKSDWHRYNLKRREAGLPMLREEDFKARLEAALALRHFQRTSTFDEHTLSRPNTGADHDGRGRGEAHGAWTRYDEHRHGEEQRD